MQSVWSDAGGGGGASLFGLDPFSGSGSGTGGASGGVGGGPTATTPTDPFTSDPFLEDPFGEKGNVGGEANPFATDSSDIFGSKGWSDSKVRQSCVCVCVWCVYRYLSHRFAYTLISLSALYRHPDRIPCRNNHHHTHTVCKKLSVPCGSIEHTQPTTHIMMGHALP